MRLFVQLIKLEPTIELLDMYVSDNIKLIFSNVKKYYQARMKYLQSLEQQAAPAARQEPFQPDPPQAAPLPLPAKAGQDKPAKSRAWIGWTGGGLLVAGSVTAFLLLSDPGEEVRDKSRGTVTLKQ